MFRLQGLRGLAGAGAAPTCPGAVRPVTPRSGSASGPAPCACAEGDRRVYTARWGREGTLGEGNHVIDQGPNITGPPVIGEGGGREGADTGQRRGQPRRPVVPNLGAPERQCQHPLLSQKLRLGALMGTSGPNTSWEVSEGTRPALLGKGDSLSPSSKGLRGKTGSGKKERWPQAAGTGVPGPAPRTPGFFKGDMEMAGTLDL